MSPSSSNLYRRNEDNSFLGAYLKVYRAQFHIEMIRSNSQPISPNLFEISWIKAIGLPCGSSYAQISTDPDSNIQELAFIPKAPLAQVFAVMIGDAVHNLRAALDYAATAVCRARNVNTSFVTFPFHEKRKDLVEARSSGIKALQLALPDAEVERFFQDTIKAYSDEDGNPDIWTLTKLDKIDKHNFIIPNLTVAQLEADVMFAQSGNISVISTNKKVGNDASRPFAFTRIDASEGLPEIGKINTSAMIHFPISEYYSGLEVIETLTKVSKLVLETLFVFEDFAVENGVYKKAIRGEIAPPFF